MDERVSDPGPRRWRGRLGRAALAVALLAGGKVRVEIANPRKQLRFGMYVTMRLTITSSGYVTLVPRSAGQPLGEASVAYLPAAEGEGRLVERPVVLGSAVGDAIQVLKGLKAGERVVTEGSFFLRARGGASAVGRVEAMRVCPPDFSELAGTQLGRRLSFWTRSRQLTSRPWQGDR